MGCIWKIQVWLLCHMTLSISSILTTFFRFVHFVLSTQKGVENGQRAHTAYDTFFKPKLHPLKYGAHLQRSYPVSEWIASICNQSYSEERVFCTKLSESWSYRKKPSWKSAEYIRSIKADIELIGQEKEHLWGKLNGQCQIALVSRCEVPYVCERTLYDPIPRSMYFLTHQVFQRILTEQSVCESTKELLNDQVTDQFCSKMYQEANLISQLDYPPIFRDLFSEYVAFCGYMGYPNFFREDWIESILSWQSRSEYGCFSKGYYKGAFITSDIPIVRQKTEDEMQKGSELEEELCLPHFTTVALSALAVSWDYMEDNCK